MNPSWISMPDQDPEPANQNPKIVAHKIFSVWDNWGFFKNAWKYIYYRYYEELAGFKIFKILVMKGLGVQNSNHAWLCSVYLGNVRHVDSERFSILSKDIPDHS
jgi:hypothetical protein